MAVAQVAPSSVDNTEGDKAAIMQLAAAMRAEDIQLFYQTALVGRKDLPLAADPRQGFEMILLRMLAFKPVNAAPLNLDLVGSLQAPGSVEALPEALSAPQPEAVTDAGYETLANADNSAEKKPLTDSELAPEPVVEKIEAPIYEHVEHSTVEHSTAETAFVEITVEPNVQKPAFEMPSTVALDATVESYSQPSFQAPADPVATGFAEQAEIPPNLDPHVESEKKEPIKGGAADLLNNPLPMVASEDARDQLPTGN